MSISQYTSRDILDSLAATYGIEAAISHFGIMEFALDYAIAHPGKFKRYVGNKTADTPADERTNQDVTDDLKKTKELVNRMAEEYAATHGCTLIYRVTPEPEPDTFHCTCCYLTLHRSLRGTDKDGNAVCKVCAENP